MKNLIPGKEVPELIIDTINGMKWELRSEKPESFTLLIFYRGLHCPVCKSYLEELNENIEKFRKLGVNVICISANKGSLAERTIVEWDVDRLTIGYGMSQDAARKWDLYISEGKDSKEPAVFFEPGIFLIKPDNVLYAASIQSMPFARPELDDLLKSIKFILRNDYPIRGDQ